MFLKFHQNLRLDEEGIVIKQGSPAVLAPEVAPARGVWAAGPGADVAAPGVSPTDSPPFTVQSGVSSGPLEGLDNVI